MALLSIDSIFEAKLGLVLQWWKNHEEQFSILAGTVHIVQSVHGDQ